MRSTTVACLLVSAVFVGCDSGKRQITKSVDPPKHAKAESTTLETAEPSWERQRLERDNATEAYLSHHEVAYRWFADFPFGSTDGIPYLILKLLPKIAPEIWGSQENFLDVVGLFNDERAKSYPVARGIGWSGLARDDSNGAVDYASFTCGACHIGRVRREDGRLLYLDGGINSQFNLVLYRVKVVQTIQKLMDEAPDPATRVSLATSKILAALDNVHADDSHYFYRNYSIGGRKFDENYEANQISLFKNDALAIVGKFLTRADLELRSLVVLVKKNYKGFDEPMLQGFGGMADATGVSTSFGYLFSKEVAKNAHVDPEIDLPPTPGITDFMAVWEQSKRKVRWSKDQTHLVDGGGQWNGNIPIPVFRNLAAELTMGFGADTDVRISELAVKLLDGLPAPAYPFDVDLPLARKGQRLFEQNCQDCHRPHNGHVYKNIGSDLGRAFVVSEAIALKARSGFTGIGSPGREILLPADTRLTRPFAEFDGVSLEGKSQLSMKDPKDHEGYNALPLGGVWAQAPYLHNGSVPTLFHLLVPRDRPTVFTKSRLNYDTRHVGFAWSSNSSPPDVPEEGYRFDTKAFSAFSNSGHDKDIQENGKIYKLDWSEDQDGAFAIIEYLKTR